MSGIAELNDIFDNRRQLAEEQRQVEAEAFAVMRTRPIFFALKLLLGVNHKAIEEKPEPGEEAPIEDMEPQPA